MNIDTQWLIGSAATLVGSGVWAYIRLTERVTRLEASVHSDINERVVKIEAVFDLLGKKAAKILHSDDDPHGIDALLDKYLDRYYELTPVEWGALLAKCGDIENDKALSKGERILASWLAAVAHHKLKLPPPVKHRVSDEK